MEWTAEARSELTKVPFFIRKRVKTKVEEEASRRGDNLVRPEHLNACRQRYLSGSGMEEEVRGFRVEHCFGSSGCPNRAVEDRGLEEELEAMLATHNIRDLLKRNVKGTLKFHHEFSVSISDCPNCCSRPQIADVGLIGARLPRVAEEGCTRCLACVETCREGAIGLDTGDHTPRIDPHACLACGTCITACPSGTLRESARGYRILVGGRLGRHPRLGVELPHIYTREEAVKVVDACMDFHLEHNEKGERFGEVIDRRGLDRLLQVIASRLAGQSRPSKVPAQSLREASTQRT